jgi:hypothetical protein
VQQLRPKRTQMTNFPGCSSVFVVILHTIIKLCSETNSCLLRLLITVEIRIQHSRLLFLVPPIKHFQSVTAVQFIVRVDRHHN